MLCQLWSATTLGIEAVPVAIETNVSRGMPRFTVVGLPDVSVRESRDRIHAAIINSGFEFPRGAVTVNLAPADIRKEGTAFDLPIALSLLGAAGVAIRADLARQTVVMGELALDGTVRSVKGVLPVAVRAGADGQKHVIVPMANAGEAALVDDLKVYGVQSLSEGLAFFRRARDGPAVFRRRQQPSASSLPDHDLDFADVRGQEGAKRALEVAAAGGHNVLMIGSPGAGKTMLARRIATVLPSMSRVEALEVTKIHSVGGRLNGSALILRRPFRAPHHTISMAGLCGGGASPRPGEISLAHNGVLFMDELPEFRRAVLEVLRQPLEEGQITISRAAGSAVYPARFMLVASMNPCPCGYLSDPVRECVCSPAMIHRYHNRISGPLLDRIDVHLPVHPVAVGALSGRSGGMASEEMRDRVAAARDVQRRRLGDGSGAHCNAAMTTREVRRWCGLERDAALLLKEAVAKLRLSARGYERILRVARTIADLDAGHRARIKQEHLAEAIQYRSLDR
ncbi:MAG: YifB family Mg chelatase-like AAA ATPase, partial [Rhodothermia bacterium]|nr:YifB family Mg chelatase-like AAA ATPase [Rhodothermia bacterium]